MTHCLQNTDWLGMAFEYEHRQSSEGQTLTLAG